MSIRLATINDSFEIAEIYKYYVENTHISFEYVAPTPDDFVKRISSTLNDYPYLVYIIDNKIVGYCYASRYAERSAYGWDALLSVYVDKNFQGQGIGVVLYNKLIEILTQQNIVNIYGCITSGNAKSVAMHEKLGFKINAVFHNAGFKNNAWHDVTWLEKNIIEHSIPPKDFIPFSQLNFKLN